MATTTVTGPFKTGTVREGASSNAGWAVLSQTNTLAYTDTTAKTLFILPANAQIIEVYVDTTTAFNDSGTDTISVGFSGTQTAYVNAADVSAAGRDLGSATAANLTNFASVGTSDRTVTGIYTGQNADASAGAARVTVVYVQQ